MELGAADLEADAEAPGNNDADAAVGAHGNEEAAERVVVMAVGGAAMPADCTWLPPPPSAEVEASGCRRPRWPVALAATGLAPRGVGDDDDDDACCPFREDDDADDCRDRARFLLLPPPAASSGAASPPCAAAVEVADDDDTGAVIEALAPASASVPSSILSALPLEAL